MKQLNFVSPIGNLDTNAVPVKNISSAVTFYTQHLGFEVVSQDEETAVLKRDDVQIGLVAKADHDPATAEAFYINTVDLEALRLELESKGCKPGAIQIQKHEGNNYRMFFLRECDMMEVHDGYCFCFGHPA